MTQTKPLKYLNNIVEQEQHFIKKRVHSILRLRSFRIYIHSLRSKKHIYNKKEQIDLRG